LWRVCFHETTLCYATLCFHERTCVTEVKVSVRVDVWMFESVRDSTE
jgi:hypothetical protein